MPTLRRLLSRPYQPSASAFSVETADGVALSGHRVGPVSVRAIVLCHGFMGWHTKSRVAELAERLAGRFTVYAFDFRGHGTSRGASSFGAMEHLDVDAVVGLARSEGAARVVTVGGSMGGIAVIRHAALLGGVDAVVAISTPARWNGHETAAVRRMVWLTGTSAGRRLLRATGTRVAPEWRWAEAPADVVDRIAPTPLLLVHGRDDHFFADEDAWLLYRCAREPKRLLLFDRFGHGEDGYTERFAGVLATSIERMLAPAASGAAAPLARASR